MHESGARRTDRCSASDRVCRMMMNVGNRRGRCPTVRWKGQASQRWSSGANPVEGRSGRDGRRFQASSRSCTCRPNYRTACRAAPPSLAATEAAPAAAAFPPQVPARRGNAAGVSSPLDAGRIARANDLCWYGCRDGTANMTTTFSRPARTGTDHQASASAGEHPSPPDAPLRDREVPPLCQTRRPPGNHAAIRDDRRRRLVKR